MHDRFPARDLIRLGFKGKRLNGCKVEILQKPFRLEMNFRERAILLLPELQAEGELQKRPLSLLNRIS